jgi:hypothetical protein
MSKQYRVRFFNYTTNSYDTNTMHFSTLTDADNMIVRMRTLYNINGYFFIEEV